MLADPVRRDLYEYVADAGHEVGRAEAADAARGARTLGAFHLDKLVDAGLLEVAHRRLTGRSGPGAGRPAKVYRVAAREHLASVPPRDYRGLAMLLAEAVEAASLVPSWTSGISIAFTSAGTLRSSSMYLSSDHPATCGSEPASKPSPRACR